jgi:hypothetical protein
MAHLPGPLLPLLLRSHDSAMQGDGPARTSASAVEPRQGGNRTGRCHAAGVCFPADRVRPSRGCRAGRGRVPDPRRIRALERASGTGHARDHQLLRQVRPPDTPGQGRGRERGRLLCAVYRVRADRGTGSGSDLSAACPLRRLEVRSRVGSVPARGTSIPGAARGGRGGVRSRRGGGGGAPGRAVGSPRGCAATAGTGRASRCGPSEARPAGRAGRAFDLAVGPGHGRESTACPCRQGPGFPRGARARPVLNRGRSGA